MAFIKYLSRASFRESFLIASLESRSPPNSTTLYSFVALVTRHCYTHTRMFSLLRGSEPPE